MTHIFEVVSFDKGKLLVKLSKDTNNNELLNFFINQNVSIQSFNEVLPSLNEIFIRLVGETTPTRKFEMIN
jgi:ABC-2 type transport system ATP-binding protein